MTDRILVLYGSYRSDRMGIRLADFIVKGLRGRGADVELIDAKAVGLPMLDRMRKEYPKGEVPAALEELGQKIIAADGFVFVTGEYNWGLQPGLKNLTDHFLEEWFWRPAAIASYWQRAVFGRVAGRVYIAWCLAAVTLPVLAARLFDLSGGYGTAFLVAGACNVLAAVVALTLPRQAKPA